MSTIEQAPTRASDELSSQLAVAEASPVNKLNRLLVSGITGKPEDSGYIGASREVRDLHSINNAEDPHPEVDRLLKKAEATPANRMARMAVAWLVGKPEQSGIVGATKRVRNLQAVKDSLPPKESGSERPL